MIYKTHSGWLLGTILSGSVFGLIFGSLIAVFIWGCIGHISIKGQLRCIACAASVGWLVGFTKGDWIGREPDASQRVIAKIREERDKQWEDALKWVYSDADAPSNIPGGMMISVSNAVREWDRQKKDVIH